MAWVGSTVTTQVLGLLTMPQGLNACVATLAQALNTTAAPLAGSQLVAQNVPIDLAERSLDVTYPAVSVYCDKIVNQLKEKFRVFSGIAVMTIEVRVSQDRLEGIEAPVADVSRRGDPGARPEPRGLGRRDVLRGRI